MFTCKEIDFKDLCALEKDAYIESMLYIYEKNEYKKFEIFYKNHSIGIIILSKNKNYVCIAYFQIFKSKRKIGLGKTFIVQLITLLKTIEGVNMIYLTSLYEAMTFWIKCGFVKDTKYNDVLYYKL